MLAELRLDVRLDATVQRAGGLAHRRERLRKQSVAERQGQTHGTWNAPVEHVLFRESRELRALRQARASSSRIARRLQNGRGGHETLGPQQRLTPAACRPLQQGKKPPASSAVSSRHQQARLNRRQVAELRKVVGRLELRREFLRLRKCIVPVAGSVQVPDDPVQERERHRAVVAAARKAQAFAIAKEPDTRPAEVALVLRPVEVDHADFPAQTLRDGLREGGGVVVEPAFVTPPAAIRPPGDQSADGVATPSSAARSSAAFPALIAPSSSAMIVECRDQRAST